VTTPHGQPVLSFPDQQALGFVGPRRAPAKWGSPLRGEGLAGVLGGWVGGEWLLPRVLPLRRIDHTIPYAYLVSGSVIPGGVELTSSDPSCPGRLRFRTAEPRPLLESLERAMRGR
jgi:hypothetical protein